MKQYQDLLKSILNEGVVKQPARKNMPKTISLFGTRMEFDLSEGFPLLTTKKMYHKGIIVELLWFLRGDTNIKYLVDNGCKIWNDDAYRWYLKYVETNEDNVNSIMNINEDNSLRIYTKDEFIQEIKNGNQAATADGKYKLGDLGKVYGKQWRDQDGCDQVREIIEGIKGNPDSRYHILNAWSKKDFKEMALPPCHLLYQFYCRDNKYGRKVLDLQMYQRSVDSFLGLPFNIASASLLLKIIAKMLGMIPGKFIWVGGDTHIYENHLLQTQTLLKRDPLRLCNLNIEKDLNTIEDIENLNVSDFVISDYVSYDTIKAKLSTGL